MYLHRLTFWYILSYCILLSEPLVQVQQKAQIHKLRLRPHVSGNEKPLLCPSSELCRIIRGSTSSPSLHLRGGGKGAYYEILGLEKGSASTPEDIKRAYKKVALKWHPDRVKPDKKAEAEARFKKISEAYEILSDPDKKAFYDRHGDEGVQARRHHGFPETSPGGGYQHTPGGFYAGEGGVPDFVFTDPFDLFARFFSNDADPFGGMGMAGRLQRGRRGRGGLRTDMFGSTIFEAPGGFNVVIGQPSLSGFAMHMLSQCVGAWASSRAQQHADTGGGGGDGGGGVRQVRVPLECTLEDLAVGGPKAVRAPDGRELSVEVRPGWKAGTKATFCVAGGGGAAAAGGGDEDAMEVVVEIEEAPHAVFVREGDNLHWNCRITPAQARDGVEVTLPTLIPADGRSQRALKLHKGIEDGETLRVKGRGMPIRGGPARGDMLVTVLVAPWFESVAVRASELAWYGAERAGRRVWKSVKRLAGLAGRAAERYLVAPVRQSDLARKMVPPVLTFIVLYMFNPVYAYMQLIIMIIASLGEARPATATG